jgi:hypothetical protein
MKKVFHSPIKKPLVMLHKQVLGKGLGEDIGGLVLSGNLVEGEGCPFSLDPRQPMEIFHIDVLGAGRVLGGFAMATSPLLFSKTEQCISFLWVTTRNLSSFISVNMC